MAVGLIQNQNPDWTVKQLVFIVGAPNRVLASLPPRAHFEFVDVDIPPFGRAAISFHVDIAHIEPKYRNDWFVAEAKGEALSGD